MRPRESQGNLWKDSSHSGAAAKRPFSFTNVRQKQPRCQREASDLTPFFSLMGKPQARFEAEVQENQPERLNNHRLGRPSGCFMKPGAMPRPSSLSLEGLC